MWHGSKGQSSPLRGRACGVKDEFFILRWDTSRRTSMYRKPKKWCGAVCYGQPAKLRNFCMTMKIGIIGTGNIAPAYIKGCSQFPQDVEIVACADMMMDKAKSFADTHDLQALPIDDF